MRFFRAIFATLFFLIFLLIVGFYFLLQMDGRRFIQARLADALDRPVTIGRVNMLLPFGVRLEDVSVGGELQAGTVELQLSLPVFLNRQILIDEVRLVKPRFVIHRLPEGRLVWGEPSASTSPREEGSGRAPSASGDDPMARVRPVIEEKVDGILIDHLQITDGTVEFTDIGPEETRHARIGQIRLSARQVPYPPRNLRTQFDLSALMTSPDFMFSGSRAEAAGWVNYPARDLDARVKFSEGDGMVHLDARLTAQSNDLTVAGKCNVGRLTEAGAGPGGGEGIDDFVKAAIQAAGVEVMLDFSFQTKMDDFRVASIPFSGEAAMEGPDPEDKEALLDLGKIGERFEALGRSLTEIGSGSPSPEGDEE